MRPAAVFTFMVALWATPLAFGEPPSWANQIPRHFRKYLTLSCEGQGPAMDLAIHAAVGQCVSMASDQLIDDFHVRSLSTETEKSVGFHEEVSADRHIEGLSCDIKKQRVDEQDGAYHAWILCSFDTSNVKTISGKSVEPQPAFVASSTTSIVISTVPPCDTILVSGQKSRVIDCKDNPMSVLFQAGDQEIIVRANGFIPKHVRLDGMTKSPVEVYLERE